MTIEQSMFVLDRLVDAVGSGLIAIYTIAIMLKVVKSFIVFF